jgi:DNA-binding NarL/FixJ family response regulator
MDTNSNKIKVLVVNDHPVVAEGTVSLLSNERRISVVGTAKTGEECLQSVDSLKPDVVLLDINLPDICGVDLVEKLREMHPRIKVIMFIGQNPQEYVNGSLAIGVEGFLLKYCSANEMTEAVLSVFEGEVYYSRGMGAIIKALETDKEHRRQLSSIDLKDISSLLTPRELEVMELVAQGLQNKDIAAGLGIKKRTVDFHIGNILSKLGASSRSEAVVIWKGFK